MFFMKESTFYKFIKSIFAPILSIFWKIEVHGSENIPQEGKFILCSNHISNMDPILLDMVFRRQIFFMAKEELFKNKLFGNFIKKLGAFPVKRGKGDIGALNLAKKILENGNILGIFIEGTRSKTGELLKPKPGAVILANETKSKILPVCIKSAFGTKVKMFKKVIINIGESIEPTDLGIVSGKSVEIRSASRFVMDKIAELKSM